MWRVDFHANLIPGLTGSVLGGNQHRLPNFADFLKMPVLADFDEI